MQPLAVFRAQFPQVRQPQRGAARQMVQAHACPEFADAARHEISVLMKFRVCRKRARRFNFAESCYIQHLPFGDLAKDRANVFPVSVIQPIKTFKAIRQRFDQHPLRLVRLQRRK